MQSEMVVLVERLVVAMERVSHNVESMSRDVKDMSVSLQTLTYDVSLLLKEKNNGGPSFALCGEDSNRSVTTWENEQQAAFGNASCEQDEVHRGSHSNELNLENPPFAVKDIKCELNSDVEGIDQSFSVHTTLENFNNQQIDLVREQGGILLAEAQDTSYPSSSNFYTEPFSSQYHGKRVSGSQSFFHRNSSCGKEMGEDIDSVSEEREGLMERGSVHEHSGVWNDVTGAENQQNMPTEQSVKQKRPFLCDTCGKSFANRGELERHKRLHSDARPFACTLCDKTYRDKQHLVVHMRKHSGERPCQCTVCGKAFAQHTSLRVHMLTHTGEKPFKCTECGKAFSVKSNLVAHIRIHTGERPFSCSICGKCFAQSQHLSKHMVRFHTDS